MPAAYWARARGTGSKEACAPLPSRDPSRTYLYLARFVNPEALETLWTRSGRALDELWTGSRAALDMLQAQKAQESSSESLRPAPSDTPKGGAQPLGGRKLTHELLARF